MRRLLAVLILFALAGCSRRERANPLDPLNPQTGGIPTGFNAVADFSIVRLFWDARPDLAIDGFQLERLAPGDSVYRPIATMLPRTVARTTDTGVTNGSRFQYRLRYVIGGRPANRFAADFATPGAARVWVSDYGWPGLLRISPDGRDVAEVAQGAEIGAPAALAFDPLSRHVWYTRVDNGQAGIFDPNLIASQTFNGFTSATEIALDPANESGWITDFAGGMVRHLFPTGAAATPGSLQLLDGPTGLAVDPADRSVWVCEKTGNRVRHYDVNGSALATANVNAPSRVAVDSLSHVAWVTSLNSGRITRLAPDGRVLDSLTVASGPIGITLDRDHDRAWIADAIGNRVVVVTMSTRTTLFIVTGLQEPRDIAIDRASGEAWIVARAEGAVLRLSPTGQVLERLKGLVTPYEIRFDPGN